MTFDFPVPLLYETLRERGSKLRAASRREGADLIYGEAGDDWLDRGTGSDRLYGGDGNDQL
ncbi:hypothetical protein [Nostoc sp.]|uniref:hypothetical protein n=1 Tax=Nostoc sp. TaxID=1180 RepID=UPI002FFCDC2E